MWLVSDSPPFASCCDLLGFLRLGAANMALCVFLSMKNTPLSFLAATSHAELNVLHRIVGYAAGILVLLHAVLYTIHFGIQDRWETLIEPGNIEGIGSGVAMIVLLLGTFRSRNYSLFYLSHIIGFVAALVLTGLHRPDWAKKLPVVVLCIASIWAADRSIRAARSSYNAINNQVTLYPLPDGGTRLLVKKPSNGSVLPGTHCYIWIPRLRLFHAHPFTVVSSSPYGLEFVAKSYKRFTKDLSGLATNHPGICISRVFLDGPYGSMPDNSGYDKVVLIAGGSGGAFTFGLINRILNHSSRISLQAIDFVWAVKRTGKRHWQCQLGSAANHNHYLEHLFWFHEHLNDIMAAAAGINVQVYVTEGSPPNAQRVSAVEHDICTTEDTQNDLGVVVPRIKSGIHETLQSCNVDDLLSGAAYCEKVRWQKMDVEVVIREAVEATEGRQRVLIATCGPTPLTNAVKDTAQSLGDQTGYKVDVHAENFSS